MIRLAPSNLERYSKCPGAYWAEKGLPFEPSSAADAGNRMHAYISQRTPLNDIPDRGERYLVEKARAIARQLLNDCGIERSTARSEVSVTERIENAEIAGRMDWVGASPFTEDYRALTIDFKFGHGEAETADRNLQLRSYAILLSRLFLGCNEYRVAIIQPTAWEPLSVVTYTPEDIELAKRHIREIAADIWDCRPFDMERPVGAPGGNRKAGMPQCRYCKALGTSRCPESRDVMLAIRPSVTDVMPFGLELADLLDKGAHLTALYERLKDHARTLLESGDDPELAKHWKLGKQQIMRDVPDANRAWERIAPLGVTAEQFADCLDVSVKSLEGVVRETLKCTWPHAKQVLADALGDAMTLKPKAAPLERVE